VKKTLIFAIVEEGKAERLMNVAKAAGSHGGTILTGQGSGASGMLSLLGLTDFHREILLTIVEDSVKDSVWKALCECKIRKVLLTSIPLQSDDGAAKPIESTFSMICVICPSGYGWDVLHAARKVGVGGGTIVGGRGTANPEDIAFHGSYLVPEKEVVFMISENEIVDAAIRLMSKIPGLAKPGNGIVFTIPLEQFQKVVRKEG
jgi:nitrogen regulatory protein PII